MKTQIRNEFWQKITKRKVAELLVESGAEFQLNENGLNLNTDTPNFDRDGFINLLKYHDVVVTDLGEDLKYLYK